jgi:hypothetical protein
MSDLVKRLRDTDANADPRWIADITEEAAKRIETLEAALQGMWLLPRPWMDGGVTWRQWNAAFDAAIRALEGKP